MANNIGIANNEKLLTLHNEFRNGLLILRPSFQRNLVWNTAHKENFIETILEGLPFPEIYLADGDINLEKKESTRLVVDGQQRLSTINSYITGEMDLKRLPKFEDLTDTQKTNFYDYQVVVRNLGRLDNNQISEIFKRINSINYALNATEINNALYEGEFISTAKDIQDASKLKKLNIFSENESARMRDIEFVLLVMSTIEEGGYFGSLKEVETYIKKFNDNYPDKEEMKRDVLFVMDLVATLGLSSDSIWFRKSSLFTLLVELIKAKRKGIQLEEEKVKEILDNFENEILSNKSGDIEKNPYSRFYYYIFQGTAGRAGRIYKGELLEKNLSKLSDE